MRFACSSVSSSVYLWLRSFREMHGWTGLPMEGKEFRKASGPRQLPVDAGSSLFPRRHIIRELSTLICHPSWRQWPLDG